MPVPTFDQFIEPLLRFLAEHPDGTTVVEAYEVVANRVGLTADDRAELLPSGAQAVYKNRIGWAQDRLKRAGFSSSPRWGFWKLTPVGSAFANANRVIPPDELEQLASVGRGRLRLRSEPGQDGSSAAVPLSATASNQSPEERIDAAVSELRDSVARDLLELIGRAPPEFFENLVLDLLHALGYGTNRSDLQRVGGSGDGGIDGIISLDRLGLEKVYVQAKRWKDPVGSPEIQTFMGALQLQGAAKGVLITTSSFTRSAREAVPKARGAIVLVDGAMLSNLMIDHGVAVSHKTLRIPKVDSDYFEEV
jgi:restriction system protein